MNSLHSKQPAAGAPVLPTQVSREEIARAVPEAARYTIHYVKDPTRGIFIGSFKEIPNLTGEGSTEQECKMVSVANLAWWIAIMRKKGKEIPPPQS